MDQDEYRPDTESHGMLVPPTRHPPTALAVSTPPPPPAPRALPRRRRGVLGLVASALEATLDAADRVGDAIATTLGLREGAGPPPPGPSAGA